MTERTRPARPTLAQFGHNFWGAQMLLLIRIFKFGEAPRNPWLEP